MLLQQDLDLPAVRSSFAQLAHPLLGIDVGLGELTACLGRFRGSKPQRRLSLTPVSQVLA